jgi:hypothetical protein
MNQIRLYVIIAAIIFGIIAEFLWRRKHKRKLFDISKAVKIGELLFESKSKEFEEFVHLFSGNKSEFSIQYESDFEDMGLTIADVTLLDLLAYFGDNKNEMLIIDWRGEENEGEIQAFCEEKLNRIITWSSVNKLRDQTETITLQKLFELINSDLKNIGYQLIFSNRSNDSYEIFVTTNSNFRTIQSIDKTLFVEKK